MSKGKNFSMNNVGQRKKSDFYETPYSLTRIFLDNWDIPRNYSILEPACGEGAIVKVLQERGFSEIVAYDKETNFLLETRKYDYLITNPPFSLALEFILKAKK